jgi:hypothetical protein
MMKSANTGDAETGAVLAGHSAAPGMAREAAGNGDDPGRGGDAGGRQQAARVALRQLIDERLDALLEQSRDETGALTGEGSMLGELVKAILERVVAAEPTAHPVGAGQDRSGGEGPTSETGHESIGQPDSNRRSAHCVPEQGSDACLNGGSHAHRTRGR